MSRPQIIRGPALVSAVAFLVRVAFFVVFFRAVPIQKVWETGLEAGHLAASLVSGHGFASPFGVPTGPSAWLPPVYSGVLAILFRFFGAYSAAAAWSVLLLNALLAAGIAWTMYAAGEKVLGGRVGVIAAWVWALSPYAVIMCVKVWDTSLSALLVMVGSLLYWKLRACDRLQGWAIWGLFWGFAALVNPGLGIFFPFLTTGARWRTLRQSLPQLALAVAAFCVVVAPWTARNQARFHAWVPIRSNFGVELWLGNHEGVEGPDDETRHPLGDPHELAAYSALGERKYVAEKLHAATAFIVQHPWEFARLTLFRIAFFWSGPRRSLWILLSLASFLGLGLRIQQGLVDALPFAVALLVFPGVYYLTHADNWYRYPIEPAMTLLVVYAIVRAQQRLAWPPARRWSDGLIC